jgi:hypothetical protein
MPNISGSFSGKVNTQTVFSLRDQPNHQLQAAEVAGAQRSSDPDWNDTRMTYWGTTDHHSGNGTQHGYFINERPGGERDWGTFEGTLASAGNAVTIAGTYTYTGGSGKFNGITGKGTYRGRMISPTEVEMDWKGTYQLAGARSSGAA